MERVIAYIDGYNLYYGLRSKGWKWAYWLNLQVMVTRLLKPRQNLIATKYFTAVVRKPHKRHERQAVFLEALQTLDHFHIYYGHFLSNPVTCTQCSFTHETYHEKMTDVNIAVEMLTDAAQDRLDTALLVSADSDLVGVVNKVRYVFKKRVIIAFPPKRHSAALRKVCNGYVYIGRNVLVQSLFPEKIVKPDGFVLQRPEEWR